MFSNICFQEEPQDPITLFIGNVNTCGFFTRVLNVVRPPKISLGDILPDCLACDFSAQAHRESTYSPDFALTLINIKQISRDFGASFVNMKQFSRDVAPNLVNNNQLSRDFVPDSEVSNNSLVTLLQIS